MHEYTTSLADRIIYIFLFCFVHLFSFAQFCKLCMASLCLPEHFPQASMVTTLKFAETERRYLCVKLALSVNTRNLSQYQYHAKMDAQIEACLQAMSTGMTSRLSAVLEATLAKIARFDEGRWVRKPAHPSASSLVQLASGKSS